MTSKIKPLLISMILLSTYCCNRQPNHLKSLDVNAQLKGQTFIGNSNSSIEYRPHGIYIKEVSNDTTFWKVSELTNHKTSFNPKYFFDDNDLRESYLIDSLNNEHYDIIYTSVFMDTIVEKIKIEEPIEVRLEQNFYDFYKISNTSNDFLDGYKNNDTIQLHFKKIGCFGGNNNLIEFYGTEDSLSIRRKYLNPNNLQKDKVNWDYISDKISLETIQSLLLHADTLSLRSNCSSTSYYNFKIKGKHNVLNYKVVDCSINHLDTIIHF